MHAFSEIAVALLWLLTPLFTVHSNTTEAQAATTAATAAHRQPRLVDLLTEPSWRNALAAEFGKPYMSTLQAFVASEWTAHKVFPPQQFVFRWATAVSSHSFDQVRL